MIRRCRALRLQPRSTNSRDSQSSSFGCDGRSPVLPKFAGRAHQTHTEVMLPDAVHHDAGRQGMVGLSQPFGQGQTPPGGFGAPVELFDPVGPQLSVEHRRHPGQHQIPGIGVFAPSQNPGGRRTTSHVIQRPYLGLGLQLVLLLLDLLLDLLGGLGKVLEPLKNIGLGHLKRSLELAQQIFLNLGSIFGLRL